MHVRLRASPFFSFTNLSLDDLLALHLPTALPLLPNGWIISYDGRVAPLPIAPQALTATPNTKEDDAVVAGA
jgi:hypothetical protein